jgi:hypothetical protein
MKQNEIAELPDLRTENFENIFNVYKDENGMYFYNLLQTVVFPSNLPLNLFTPYTIKYDDTWPNIAYKTLNNTNVWWVILLVNNIENPVARPVAGTIIKIPKPELVKQVLSQMLIN